MFVIESMQEFSIDIQLVELKEKLEKNKSKEINEYYEFTNELEGTNTSDQ